MNKLLKIKHIHHLLELLIYTPDSIEHVTNLKSFVKFYCEPKNDKDCMEICLTLLEYSIEIGANKVHFIDWTGEYSKQNQNIKEGILAIRNDWVDLQKIKKINNKETLVEYWIEWTDEFREELKRIDIL